MSEMSVGMRAQYVPGGVSCRDPLSTKELRRFHPCGGRRWSR